MQTEINSSVIKQYGFDGGASVVGIAAASDFTHAPDGFKPTDVLENCLSVIVLGIPFSRETLDLGSLEYTQCRNAILTKMTDVAKIVAKRITKESGHKAKAISATGGKWAEGDGRKEHFGYISLKHAAELAGLGVITRNYLLTSPEHGNLLWFSAVLTDAGLTPDEKLQRGDFCENCNRCVESCPSGALDNPASFGRKQCDRFFVMENKRFVIKCFRCRAVCPYRFGHDNCGN